MKLTSGLPLFVLLARNQIAYGISFVNGLVTPESNVTSHALLSRDVRDMTTALEAGDFTEAKSIYENGKNSLKYSKDKIYKGMRTLKGFSSAATSGKFDLEPTFLYAVWGVTGGDYTAKEEKVDYADQYVTDLLKNTDSGTLAAEAAVALNVWMYTTHEIYDSLDDCRRTEAGTNADGLNDNGLGVKALDEALAFYIGIDQGSEVGSDYFPYNLAQEAEQNFGIDSGGIAVANQKFVAAYNEYKAALASDKKCHPGSGTTKNLHYITRKMISAMTIPLMQKLIHSIVDEDKDRINLYALSVVPQISYCQKSVGKDLMSKLYTQTYNKSDQTEVIKMLQSSFDCLGITCADIGAYKTNVIGQCADPSGDLELAGYKPSTEVHNEAKIDLDILQMKILARYSAWTPAQDIYKYGLNAAITNGDDTTYLSLMDMATLDARSNAAPIYDYFKSYNSSPDYGDKTIMGALQGTGRYAQMSEIQRGEFAFKTAQYQVTYMYSLAHLFTAAKLCKDKDTSDNVSAMWDKGVATLVGSLEGPDEGGAPTSDGMLMYNLANKRCEQFGTCDTAGIANVITKLMAEFKSGQAGAKSSDCASIETAASTIGHLALVPAMQGTMRYAIKNQEKAKNSDHKDVAEGEVFSNCFLPVMNEYNKASAEVIEDNFVIKQSWQPVADGSQAVATAIGSVAPDFGVTCSDLGSAEDSDPCVGIESARANAVTGIMSLLTVAIVSSFIV